MLEEVKSLQRQIDGHEGGVKELTGGYTSEQLITKVVTDKCDKNGKLFKEVKYVPNQRIVFNEEERCYYIMISEESVETVTTEEPVAEAAEVTESTESEENIETVDNELTL